MSTTEFPEVHWDHLRTTMETAGPEAVIAFIDGFEGDRLKLYRFAQGAFSGREWEGKQLDACIAVADAGIDLALRMSATSEGERATELKDTANMMSYNLTADLADCWPGDDLPRERRHYERGLKAAEQCIAWREELGKPASRKSIAYWAQGIHALSLGDIAKSCAAFGTALDLGAAGAAESGADPAAVAGDFNVILNGAYLGIAETAGGIAGGAERYRAACAAFEAQLGSEQKAEDAKFGLAQVRKVAARVGLE